MRGEAVVFAFSGKAREPSLLVGEQVRPTAVRRI